MRYPKAYLPIFFLVALVSITTSVTAVQVQTYGPQTASRLARIMDRQIMFTLTSEECPHCEKFENETLKDARVVNILNSHFITSLIPIDSLRILEISGLGEITNYDLAIRTGYQGTPHTVLLHPELAGLPIPISGNVSPERLVSILTYFGKTADRRGIEYLDVARGNYSGEFPGIFYNYRNPIKKINSQQAKLLTRTKVDLPLVTSLSQLEGLDESEISEVILQVTAEETPDSPGLVAKELLAQKSVHKVYILEPEAEN